MSAVLNEAHDKRDRNSHQGPQKKCHLMLTPPCYGFMCGHRDNLIVYPVRQYTASHLKAGSECNSS